MKYSCHYSNKNSSILEFEEVIINYDFENIEIIQYLEEHKQQRTILLIRDIQSFIDKQFYTLLNAIKLKGINYNFAVLFYDIGRFEPINSNLIEAARNLEVDYFFGKVASTFDQLNYLISLGVSDVYITEELGFYCKEVADICHQANISVRAFPNVGQSSAPNTPALKKFFIRPEDVHSYEKYIDVLEFWGPDSRSGIYLKIYQRGVWFGNLDQLILDLGEEIDSKRILPIFGQQRANCHRKCAQGKKCTICNQIVKLSHSFEDKGIIINYPRNN